MYEADAELIRVVKNLDESVKLLQKEVKQLYDTLTLSELKEKKKTVLENSQADTFMYRKLKDVNNELRIMSTRAENALLRAGVVVIGDLLYVSEGDLLNVHQCGSTSRKTIKAFCKRLGIQMPKTSVAFPPVGVGDPVVTLCRIDPPVTKSVVSLPKGSIVFVTKVIMHTMDFAVPNYEVSWNGVTYTASQAQIAKL